MRPHQAWPIPWCKGCRAEAFRRGETMMRACVKHQAIWLAEFMFGWYIDPEVKWW